MKKFVLALVFLLITSPLFALDGDIVKTEVRADVSGYRLVEVRFEILQKKCEITYYKIDEYDNLLDSVITVIIEDSEFIQLITAINNGSNIKNTITNAAKIKLGI